MFKSFVTLLFILVASSSVLSSKFAIGGKEFTHLRRTIVQDIDELDYFISVAPNTWSGADMDCRYFFGANATLVAIESEEEWDFLKLKLENYGSMFWTGGMYLPQSSVWAWSANSQNFPPWAPWDQGHPAPNPNPLHRVTIAHWSRHLAYWRSATFTELYPYICEIQRPTRAVECYEENDLIIVLDSSVSIGSENYAKTLRFVERLAAAFTVHPPSRFGFLLFSETTELLIDITNTYTREAISSIIVNAPYMNKGTATWLGIDLAINRFNSSPREVPLNMVVLTDGMSNDEQLTIAAAQRATARGIRSFSVGITDETNPDELLVIAGGVTNRIFTTDTFDELVNLLAPVSLRVCSDE